MQASHIDGRPASPEEGQSIEHAYREYGLPGVLRVEAQAHQKTGAFFEAARCYAQAGQRELAFALLEDGYMRHHPGLSRLNIDPDFDPVRLDPRFQDLLRRLELPK